MHGLRVLGFMVFATTALAAEKRTAAAESPGSSTNGLPLMFSREQHDTPEGCYDDEVSYSHGDQIPFVTTKIPEARKFVGAASAASKATSAKDSPMGGPTGEPRGSR